MGVYKTTKKVAGYTPLFYQYRFNFYPYEPLIN